jgi:RNA polymerase sigma-70 factor (ECF subfamily)
MYSTALRYTSDKNDCEDIVQDSVEKLIQKVKKLRELPSCALPVYIVYTVRNTAIDFRKHMAIVEQHCIELEGFDDDTLMSSKLLPDEILLLTEKRANLIKIWPLISEQEQDVLYRKYILEQSDKELAVVLHCKKSSVRMYLTRTRRKARSLFEENSCDDKT